MKFARVVLKVKDYKTSFEFYHDKLGLNLLSSWQREDSWGALFNAGPATVEIIWFPSGEGLEDCNYTPERSKFDLFFDAGDVNILYKRLLDKDIEVVKEPYDAAWGYRLFKIKDPNGFMVSFMEPIK